MPEVTYKTKTGMKKKMFPYTKKGTEDAKSFAKLTGGKMKTSIKDAKMKYAKKT